MAQLVLPSHVPHRERHVLVLHLLHIEPCSSMNNSAMGHGQEMAMNMMYLELPIVGMDERTSPMCSLYSIVVFPAASSPSIRT
uniref:Uncharacterized protein n=1 Tax=Oryza brachyantha TaxID=4533 RepID=J3MAQ9_ORYBR